MSQIPQITVSELDKALTRADGVLVDVRETGEYDFEHIDGAKNLPGSRLAEGLASLPKDKPLYVQCQGGVRSQRAAKTLLEAGFSRVYNVEGGIEAWKQAGLPIQRGKGTFPVMRQVQIVAGAMALAGGALPGARWLAVLAGAGLLFAGVSGICMMAGLLSRMPWNRGK